MKKRFIICINNSTAEQEKLFIDFIKSNSVAWWHWLKNTWLISDTYGNLTCTTIRDAAIDIFESENLLVFEFREGFDTWAGMGPITEKRNMFKWLRNYWEKK
jgi:hypothetical protein